MSETVLWLWYCARHAQRRHWYALAARYYRLCDMVYQCADDLGPFDQECYDCGNAADDRMRRMLSKLPKEEADEILEEAHDYHASRAAGGTYFFFDWQTFMHEQIDRLDDMRHKADAEWRQRRDNKLWRRILRKLHIIRTKEA